MSIVQSIILGLIQGIAEFLPISSTGHLVLAREAFGFGDANGLAFDAILQLATSLAVLIYFRREFIALLINFLDFIRRKPGDYTLLLSIILGTIPAVILGLLLKDEIETSFRSPVLVAVALIAGSVLFYIAERFGSKDKTLDVKKGVVIGLFQSLALVPGMSRSGSTISGSLLLGLNRIDAARFSFLLSFPIIFGAGSYELLDVLKNGTTGVLGLPLFVGSVVAFVSGLLSIHYLLKILKRYTLMPFIVYRVILALLILAVVL